MKSNPILRSKRLHTLVCAVGLLCAATAFAAPKDQTERNRQYQQDKQACLRDGATHDVRACLREAGAVRTDPGATKGGLSADQREKNALSRCDGMSESDHRDCLARMGNSAAVTGSVQAGGTLREVVTPVPAAEAAPAN